ARVEVSRSGSLAIGGRAKRRQHQTAERYCNCLDFLLHDSSFFDFNSLIAAHASGRPHFWLERLMRKLFPTPRINCETAAIQRQREINQRVYFPAELLGRSGTLPLINRKGCLPCFDVRTYESGRLSGGFSWNWRQVAKHQQRFKLLITQSHWQRV